MSTKEELIAAQLANGSLVAKQFGDVFYIATAYGVFPDGTDVTSKLQNLVDMANAANRTTIVLPSGQYRVTGLVNDNNIVFFGDGASFVGGYNKEINSLSDSLDVGEKLSSKADISYVDSTNHQLNVKIDSVSSGSPKGVYATLAALTAALPAGNNSIYLVSADGKWYYWSGSAWTAGGTYQSTGLSANAVKYENIGTTYLYAYAVNGDINIDTTAKTMTFPPFNILWGGRQNIVASGTLSFSSLSTGAAINVYYDSVANSFVFYDFTNPTQLNQNLILFGTLFGNKFHNSLSNKFIKVNGVQDGGWYVPPTDTNKNRITSLNEAWNNWEKGNKYPIAFFGDSTTDGATTSYTPRNVLGTDYINPYAYPYLLEQLIKQETGNTNVRIYNAGFNGTTAAWAKDNVGNIFGSGKPYADSKMVGISFGINDSLTDDIQTYYNTFKSSIEWLIQYFKGKNIQPFLITTQATLVKKGSNIQTQTNKICTVANQVKFELANKYNLEIFDNNKYTEMLLIYSKLSINSIAPDSLHFTDVGHKYEADYHFSEICPRVIKSSKVKEVSMITQKGKTDLLDNQFTRSTTSKYKYIVDFTRATTTDLKVLDVLLFNDEQTQLKLKVTGDVVIKINGNTINPLTYEVDLGLHRIEVISNKTRVYFEGIDITRS